MIKYFLTLFLFIPLTQASSLKQTIVESNYAALVICLGKNSITEEEQKELITLAEQVYEKRKKDFSYIWPSWDSAKLFGGLTLTGASSYQLWKTKKNNLVPAIAFGLFLSYRGTQGLWQGKHITNAKKIIALLKEGTDESLEVPNDWYKNLSSPYMGLVATATGMFADALKNDVNAASARIGLILTSSALIASFLKDRYLSYLLSVNQLDSLEQDLRIAIETANPGKVSQLLKLAPNNAPYKDILIADATKKVESCKEQLLLPKTDGDRIQMAGGTTLALLGYFMGNAFPAYKNYYLGASCTGLYFGFQGLRRSSQQNAFARAKEVLKLLEDFQSR